MIKELKLINFRNFEELILKDLNKENFIIWENWKWKTNILEAISILSNNSITWLSLDELIKKWEDYFFVEYLDEHNNKFSVSYIKDKKKKTFMYNNNKITKKKYNSLSKKSVIFSPIIMNLMYLSPSLRRDFLDNILKSSFENYDKLLTNYKKILKHRNKTLKSINESKAKKEDIIFWDKQFVELSSEIYKYRFKIINFYKESIKTTLEYFSWNIKSIDLIYETKVEQNNIQETISTYLNKNIDRDIILWKTAIWPHVDDFNILIDWESLTHFASRWETKSIIIWLKLLEWIFIEKMTNKKPILLIDDLLSELDEKHKNMLISKIKYYQTFITSITLINNKNTIKI